MHTVILVTARNTAEAKRIANALVAAKLVACVNLIKGVHSLFRWQGKVDEAREVLLIIKTRKNLVNKVSAAVKKIHSYDCPEIIALPVIGGSKDYLKWITDSTKG